MWSNDLLSIIFTRVKVLATAKLKDKYPNIYFTTSTRAQTNPKFPTVVMQKLQSTETGRDLEGRSVNGINFSVQVDVIDNSSQNTANTVADVVMKCMKDMMFEVVGDPMTDESELTTYRNVARYRRKIDYNDVL